MSRRWNAADIDALAPAARSQVIAQLRASPQTGQPAVSPSPPAAGRRKYGNVPAIVEGIRFDSKREAQVYKDLVLQRVSGAIRGFARQVSFPLASTRRIRLDFVVVEPDGRTRYLDAKGFATEAWKVKRAEFEALMGVKIETV